MQKKQLYFGTQELNELEIWQLVRGSDRKVLGTSLANTGVAWVQAPLSAEFLNGKNSCLPEGGTYKSHLCFSSAEHQIPLK